MAANNSIRSIARLPINITIDREDLEADEELPPTSKSVNYNEMPKKSRSWRQRIGLASQIETGMKDIGVYIDVNPHKEKKTNVDSSNHNTTGSLALNNAEKLMEKSVIKPGFEKLDCVPQYNTNIRQRKTERKKESEKTKGGKWFNLPATEMTEEKLRDLEVIQMRSILNPKQFYKKNDLKVVPKYFQVGTVVDSHADFYHDRVPRKDRKKNLVDELMADADFQRYNKRKYAEIIQTKPGTRPQTVKKRK
ncbi:deoxynucleotidyltransferase terminal-interacting protein 2-like [Daphnia carinata]|uniref:deoxynucleotidyltransferase terminal-interacting protein 2-like n=1 Tax=Daphnia carinata TaxID=120202 RepID=UPI00257FC87A|nr:deoxynucleotidyltransferase terminal-interacting protein 2-like [Daphnia carinata]